MTLGRPKGRPFVSGTFRKHMCINQVRSFVRSIVFHEPRAWCDLNEHIVS